MIKTPKVRADMILKALSKRNERDIFITEVKTGPTIAAGPPLHKIDALSIKPSWANPCITAYEVKVSRNGFLGDEKWPAYREVCHRFYWACPAGLIQPSEVADDCGLVWYNPETGGLSTRKKALFRVIEMPTLLLYYIVISRLGDQERHPFFSGQREQLEAWLADKTERHTLAREVKSRLFREISETPKEIDRLKGRIKQLEGEMEGWNEVAKVLKEHRISTYRWSVAGELHRVLSTGVTGRAAVQAGTVAREAEKLAAMLNGAKE